MTGTSEIDSPERFQAAFGVSRETIEKLVTYETMLKRWQKTINLVAPSTLEHVWHRHFSDSAQLWRLRPPGAVSWLDLGSGAGFPGLVIAIMASAAGGTHHTLIESDSRKAAFIREAARAAGVVVDILCTRIEISETRAKVGETNCVTARALAPLPRLVELAYPFFGPSTVGLFSKGREAAAEIEQARQGWAFTAELSPSVTDPQGSVVLLKSLKRKASKVETEG